jgi:D-sedoheptulose 7-phosphate isomerase
MSFVADYQNQLTQVLQGMDLDAVQQIIAALKEARDHGRTIFVCGNGGSAASASHFVCDMVKGASYQMAKRFKILSLNDGFPTMTAYANDVGYEHVFLEQLKNFAQPGDVVLAISGSGNSPNVVKALQFARDHQCRAIAMTGRDGGKLAQLAEIHLHVPHSHMGRIEDAHMIACHMIAYHFMEA